MCDPCVLSGRSVNCKLTRKKVSQSAGLVNLQISACQINRKRIYMCMNLIRYIRVVSRRIHLTMMKFGKTEGSVFVDL